jgi:hypothetical protein
VVPITFGAGGVGEASAYLNKNILYYRTLRSRCTGREYGNMSIGLDLNVCSVEVIAALTLAAGSVNFRKCIVSIPK